MFFMFTLNPFSKAKPVVVNHPQFTFGSSFATSHEARARKPVFGVSAQVRHKPGCTTTDKMARDLKFQIWEEDGLLFLISQNKGTDWATGVLGSGEKGYLFSGSWGALLIILGELGSRHIFWGLREHCQKVKKKNIRLPFYLIL